MTEISPLENDGEDESTDRVSDTPHVRWDFMARMVALNEVTGCLLWRGTTDADGYGILSAGRAYKAHRVSYEMAIGEIPDGMVIDHLCAHPRCVNPDHLEAVTPATNTQRGNQLRPVAKRVPYGPRDADKGYSSRQRRRLNKAG